MTDDTADRLRAELTFHQALRALVEQLRGGGYVDRHGHAVEQLAAFVAAEEALGLRSPGVHYSERVAAVERAKQRLGL
jgi:hypothetical protein